jgi:hypothetical protein
MIWFSRKLHYHKSQYILFGWKYLIGVRDRKNGKPMSVYQAYHSTVNWGKLSK